MGELSDLLEEFDGSELLDDFVQITPAYLAAKKASERETRAKLRAALTVNDGIYRRLPLPQLPRSK